MFLGWCISAIAIAMGAPFWFDLLSRLVNIRNTLNILSPSLLKGIRFSQTPRSVKKSSPNDTENKQPTKSSPNSETRPINNGNTNLNKPTMPTTEIIKPKMTELRGVWLLSHYNSKVLTSPDNIKRTLDFLEASGFNTLFVAVWNQGHTAFESEVMAKYGFPAQDPEYVGRDPLQEVINQAKGRNFTIFPWFEYGFAAAPPNLKSDNDHILRLKPEWMAKDQFGNIVRHGSGGLWWMNSLDKEVQNFITELILEVLDTYGSGITGVQGCDRLPAMPYLGGYDDKTKRRYKDKKGVEPPTIDASPIQVNPLIFHSSIINKQDPEWLEWVQFRANILTDYLKILRDRVKGRNSQYVFSIAPSPFKFGFNNLLQDSDTWVKEGLVDFLCPQFYRSDLQAYKNEVNDLTKRGFTKKQLKQYVPGISFRANGQNLIPNDIVKAIKHNRQKGLGGQVFFSEEELLEQEAIFNALKSGANFTQIAKLPKFPIV